ncbi:hypothetical protein P3T76_014629 [Phytophthora citrophthora]|uniref:Uncharacterized protein n=1 Tax=Phytophthora citrophthora TaxID=4793 RepID=A0AAD9G0V0_9STRA|nr:hypothetical protein P3T76_014629 [Phytophthora citrophthora]
MELNYMCTTLGMEQDDNNDNDFLPADTEESDNNKIYSSDSELEEKQNNAAGNQKSRSSKKKRKHSPHRPIRTSPHTSKPSKTPNKKRKAAQDSAPSLTKEMEDDTGGDDVGGGSVFQAEYKPRKGVSKHLEEIDSMRSGADNISNAVAPFPSRTTSTWENFNKIFDEYKQKNNLKFHVGSSKTTVYCRLATKRSLGSAGTLYRLCPLTG